MFTKAFCLPWFLRRSYMFLFQHGVTITRFLVSEALKWKLTDIMILKQEGWIMKVS